jgi:hypothetical protein
LSTLYWLYFSFPNLARLGLLGKILDKIAAFILKRIFDIIVPGFLSRTAATAGYGINISPRSENYIVSLTSFPARIDHVWICVELMLRQTFKPDKIILWLAEDQFPTKAVPQSLLALIPRGLTIEFCKEDLRSHKKYYHVMKSYSKDNIITIDDDLYYDERFLENLFGLHEKHPAYIVTNRAHKLMFDSNKKVKMYKHWKHNVADNKPSLLLVPTGGAGTLYPPNALDKEVFNHLVFKKVCFHADDLWLKVMSLRQKTLVATNTKYYRDFLTIKTTQNVKLVSTNVLSGGNDRQFELTLSYYEHNLWALTHLEN